MNHLIKDDYLLVSQNYFASDIEKGVEALREKFRAAHQIPQDAHVIFVAPGNEEKEVKFCME